MRKVILSAICILTLLSLETAGQTFISNKCDSTVLSPAEIAKCRIDSVYQYDLVPKINMITRLKTEVLPKHRKKRTALQFSDSLRKKIRAFKQIYDSTLNYKLEVFGSDMDRNQRYVQPKAYISSLLTFQIFKFYPDVYAILFNPVHLDLTPKTKLEDRERILKLLNEIIQLIPEGEREIIFASAMELDKEAKVAGEGVPHVFQGLLNENERKPYILVNYIIWTE